jgi:protease IV
MKWNFLCCALLSLAAGCGIPSFLVTPVSNSSDLDEIQVEPGQGLFAKKIAIIEVEGMLLDAKGGGLLEPTENPLSLFTQQLEKAANDDSVRAVVLRVNSPGGAVGTSDTMYDEVLKFRKKTGKPVIASGQELDASGAYYVSCAADKILVHPAGIMGSIGVIFETFDIQDTITYLGIRSYAIKSAKFKDIGSPFRHMTVEEQAIFQDMVDKFFARFKTIVATNRGITDPNLLAKVSDGRVFTANDAVALHLADQVGRLDDAIDLARQMANVPGASVVMYKRPYGYSGSIYADFSAQPPRENVTRLSLPGSDAMLPGGFYYLWMP